MNKLNTIFMGTPDIGIPCLEYLFNNKQINLKGVVSQPDRPSGRGKKLQSPPIAQFAKDNSIALLQTQNINNDFHWIEDFGDIDFILVFAFSQFLGSKILNYPSIACFNIHTSLLPKYRGAAPIQYALLNRDKETGVSIQKMVKKMDAGDIAIEKPVLIDPLETGGTLYNKLKNIAPKALDDLILSIQQDTLSFKKQNESEVSFAPTLQREDGKLNFSDLYLEVDARHRALQPWPGSYCFLNGKRLKIHKIEAFDKKLSPLEVSTAEGFLLVGVQDGSIRLSEVQLEGKKACSDIELLNGLRSEFKLS